jgi:DNA repair protein RadA/Sms
VEEFNGLVSKRSALVAGLFTFLPSELLSLMMSKIKTAFFCNNCGYESAKWLGKCPSCEQWNTFTEEVINKDDRLEESGWKNISDKKEIKTISIHEVISGEEKRIVTPDAELNRVLGGGIVSGSLILVAGEPGIGKSTLFLQIGLMLKNIITLYISGEESEQQIRMRADRLKVKNHQLITDHDNFYLLTETSTQAIFQEIKKLKPQVVIVDSIQTLQSSYIDSTPGTISQIRECASEFQRFAKETGTPVFLIGHITKDGNIAGPKILEHMVDTVLQFEGDRHYTYRILRTLKNRFGSTSELGIYEMTDEGMQEVNNPSEILITQKEEFLSGSAIAASIEGQRPLLIEVQALVTASVYGTPQRTVSGFDLRRLQLLLAVLEKRGGFHFGIKDVFLNIAGGLKVEDPSIDLAVLCALLSSLEDVPLAADTCFAGEVGLNGEIRAVNRISQRIAEAEKLGFSRILVSKYNQKGLKNHSHQIEVKLMGKVEEVYKYLF